MRRQWFLGLFVLLLCATPVPTIDKEAITPSSSETLAQDTLETVPRVYGTYLTQEIYDMVDYSRYRNLVREFTQNGSRFIMDSSEVELEGNRNAREYIKQKLVEFSKGRIEVEEIGTFKNIVGILPGYLPGDNPVLAVSAHYDSPEGSNGANCDGSGIAAVLELSRVMSEYEWPLDIYFIAFNALFGYRPQEGSPEVAAEFNDRGVEILMLYNVDTILVQDSGAPEDERIEIGYEIGGQSGYHLGQYWAELARMVSCNVGDDLIVPRSSMEFPLWLYSDHYTMNNRGFPSVCAFETGWGTDISFHNGNDTYDHFQFDYNLGRETTAVIGASMAHIMGRTYGELVTLSYDFTLTFDQVRRFYIPISRATTLNFSARWFGGSSAFYLLNPSNGLITFEDYNHSSAWEFTDVFSVNVTTKGLYTLVVFKNHMIPTGYEFRFTYDSDIDGNGRSDSREFWIDDSYFESDQDSDGLSDAQEYFLGTDINNADTDGDTIPDSFEVNNGLDPLDPADANQDADGDHLSNVQEYTRGLDLYSTDTDSDQMDDLWEVENGLDPLVDDSMLDPDGDGKTNLEEYLANSNPQVPQAMEMPMIWVATPILIIAATGALVYIQKTRNLSG